MYDEIHYLRDKERGVVWEESIIMAPKTARFVFLSATIPNAREFAEWIAKTHRSPCHVVYTDYRPTPLQHYLFPAGANGLYMVVDEKGMLTPPARHVFFELHCMTDVLFALPRQNWWREINNECCACKCI